jgi:uncharacterized SAM-binding protein YcdF (DUF218 family)
MRRRQRAGMWQRRGTIHRFPETLTATRALILHEALRRREMRKLYIGAILLGGLAVAPFQSALAQSTEVAYANAPQPGNAVVFFDKGTGQLSSAANETIRRAAAGADKSAGLVRVVGRADYAATVKNELVRDGVPARSIVMVPKAEDSLPTIADGVSSPDKRRVEIKY